MRRPVKDELLWLGEWLAFVLFFNAVLCGAVCAAYDEGLPGTVAFLLAAVFMGVTIFFGKLRGRFGS